MGSSVTDVDLFGGGTGDNNVLDLTGVNVQTLTASSFILSH